MGHMTENIVRKAIRGILFEEDEVTRRPGRGGYKKSISQTGALAKANPGELMKRLKIGTVTAKEEISRLQKLFDQAVGGTSAMGLVYGSPLPRKDNKTGLQGIRIPVKLVPPRDARKYLEHTLIGAQNSRAAIFDAEIQVEILGNDILLYFSDKPYTWGRQAKKKKQKQTKTKNSEAS
jgi:hypothetical protein